MAVKTDQMRRSALDVARLRADFPILEREINGYPLAYLDSASSTQKPRAVIDSLVDTYSSSYANVHRGVYTLAEETTERYEGARETVRAFLGAASTREVIFVRDTTEGLNLVAYAWGRKHLRAGDVIVATEMEHHSNLVPWQFLAHQTGALMRYVSVDDDGALDLASLERAAAEGPVRLVAAVHISNSLGTVNPIAELGAWCRAHEAVLVVDGAQSAPHRPIDVRELGCDFFAFSGHKLGGPGSGALYGREERLREMDPFLTGGEMIRSVTLDKGTTWNDLPWKFEAGTPAIAENIALGVAIDYLTGRRPRGRRPARARADGVRVRPAVGDPRPSHPRPGTRAGSRKRDLVLVRRRASARPRLRARQARDLRSRRTSLHAARHAPLRRSGDHAGELLAVLAAGGDRPPVRRARSRQEGLHVIDEFDEQLARELILDHSRHPRHQRAIEHPDASAEGQNPLCGDELRLDLQIEDGKIADVSFSGQGCSISQAATSMLTEVVVGKTVEEAAALQREDVTDLIGIPLSPVRLKCALLGLGVLKVALHRHSGTPLPADWPGLDDGITWQ